MLDAVGLRPGEHVLEIACGAGDVGLRAAEAVGPSGLVVCSDFAEPMADAVRERARELKLSQVEARVLDAEDLSEVEAYDAVLCRFGYMLMANPGEAIERSTRALRPGGRLTLAVWGPACRNPWLSCATDAAMEVLGAPPPEPETPGPFRLGDPQRVQDLLIGAGLVDVHTEGLDLERREDSLATWWAGMQEGTGPMSAFMRHLPDATIDTIRDNALQRARPFVRPDGVVSWAANVIVARARRPGGPADP